MNNNRMLVIKRVTVFVLLALLAISPFTPPVTAKSALASKILVSIPNDTATDDILYTLNPDGTGQAPLFNFHTQPVHNIGRIFQPRAAPQGETILFSSDNAYMWTAADRNLFRITSDGSWLDQITPDALAGQWSAPCPCGRLEGFVYQSPGGPPLVGSQVFLEGVNSWVFSGADGSYAFNNAPAGVRWVVAYQDGFTYSDAQPVDIPAGGVAQKDLVPDDSYRMVFQNPVQYGDRFYHILELRGVDWTTAEGSTYTRVYPATSGCAPGDIPDIDGFDAGPVSGKLAVLDYEWNCAQNAGLYFTDKDGQNRQLWVDMKTDAGWCGARSVFWSPDEARLALQVCYNSYQFILVYSATAQGLPLGQLYANAGVSIDLYGWSPGGDWLLFAAYGNTTPNAKALYKVAVNPDGSLATATIPPALLSNTRLTGATWANLSETTCVTPLTGVSISGESSGTIGTAYTFTASPSPANASTPIVYTWSPAPASGQGTSQATYNFATAGDQVIQVTASNCSGTHSANANHTITISGGETCTIPLGGVSINGPNSGYTNLAYAFSASPSPADASTPIAYAWSPAPASGQGTSQASYTFTSQGQQAIQVTASNCSGAHSANANHTITIEVPDPTRRPLYLPVIQKIASVR